MIVGKLLRGDDGRWEIVNLDEERKFEVHCGNVIDLCVDGYWIATRVEHDGDDYYPVTRGLRLLGGLPARSPSTSPPGKGK